MNHKTAYHKTDFITWFFAEFPKEELFKNMATMVEDSPWHRESNVAVHTDMVVGQYICRAIHPTWMNGDGWGAAYSNFRDIGRPFLLGAFAAAFHDVGKVSAVVYKNSPERGDYKAFHGHEKVSARMWEDWAVQNWAMLEERFMFVPEDLLTVGWMIENHLPWDLKKTNKRRDMAQTVARLGIKDAFANLLMADTTGRISDDSETKVQKSEAWVAKFDQLVIDVGTEFFETHHAGADPRLVMPIAPSGAGKSTFSNGTKYTIFSWDEERVVFAAENGEVDNITNQIDRYKVAWNYCKDNDAEFRRFWQARFIALIKTGVNIYVDNTNLSRKARRFFLDQAERRGYWKVAMLLPISKFELFNRQTSRNDKHVPVNSMLAQYNALQLPWYGEFDVIEVLPPQG